MTSAITIGTPSAASVRAISLLSPSSAPVIRATLPSRSVSSDIPQSQASFTSSWSPSSSADEADEVVGSSGGSFPER
jgi:hypothetical protein